MSDASDREHSSTAMSILEFVGELMILHLQVLLVSMEAFLKWLIPSSLRSKSLEGETMLITGAGSGIGRLFARKFSALGKDLTKRKRGGVAMKIESSAFLIQSPNISFMSDRIVIKRSRRT